MRVVGPENALSIQDFINKYWERQESLPSMKIPKAVDAWFADPKTDDERKIAAMIRAEILFDEIPRVVVAALKCWLSLRLQA